MKMTDYRPITLISSLAKIFEKNFKERRYLEKIHFLDL